MKKLLTVIAAIAIIAFAAPAFAANPFMDVPAGHWAYDAVAQLASRGVISGYPDGSYKGAQPATRYEMASIVARALAQMDTKANVRDMELLKRLVLEFKNELDALGVKVNELDKRVAVLEDGAGGWKIRGAFRLDAKFSSSDNDLYQHTQNNKKNEFEKERFRLFLTKTIDENTYFYAQYRTGGRGDLTGTKWSHLYVDTKLPYDIGLRVGRFAIDFEGDYGLYTDDDALFGDFRVDGFLASKSWGMFTATAAVARNHALDNAKVTVWSINSNTGAVTSKDVVEEGTSMAYVLDLNFRPNEKFFLGATGYWGIEDSATVAGDYDINTYGFYAGYSFTPAIALKGIYYFQDLGDNIPAADDSPNAWKAIIDVKQEALKFTSLWIEYSQVDNSFVAENTKPRYAIGNTDAGVLANQPVGTDGTTKILFVKAAQKWTDKWGSWLRFTMADFDTNGLDDAKEYGVGVSYQYTPAIQFELAYDRVDYGSNNPASYSSDKESVVRFRTTVNF